MFDKDTPLALCPRCESPNLIAVTLAYHAICKDGETKGVFDHQDWGDDYHLECPDCHWSNGAWKLTLVPNTDTSLDELKYATYDEAMELARIREEFRQERDGVKP